MKQNTNNKNHNDLSYTLVAKSLDDVIKCDYVTDLRFFHSDKKIKTTPINGKTIDEWLATTATHEDMERMERLNSMLHDFGYVDKQNIIHDILHKPLNKGNKNGK